MTHGKCGVEIAPVRVLAPVRVRVGVHVGEVAVGALSRGRPPAALGRAGLAVAPHGPGARAGHGEISPSAGAESSPLKRGGVGPDGHRTAGALEMVGRRYRIC